MDASEPDGREAVELRIERAKIERIEAVVDSGAVTPVAFSADDAAAWERARPRIEAYAERHPDATPRERFDAAKAVTRASIDYGGDPIHHWDYPLRDYPGEATDPQNLWRCDREPLETGSGRDAHRQLHEAVGGAAESDFEPAPRDGTLYDRMARLEHPDADVRASVRRHFTFGNPAVREGLEDVPQRLRDWHARGGGENPR